MTEQKYHLHARILHWVMAFGFFFMWLCGYTMTTLVVEDSAQEDTFVALHISVGVTLLLLLAVRVVVRIRQAPPPLPKEIPAFEQSLAHLGHIALYAMSIVIIALGWATQNFGGDAVEWFGLAMPKLFPTIEFIASYEADEVAETLHMWLAYIMLAMAVGHIGAALVHRWIDGIDILGRMTIDRPQ